MFVEEKAKGEITEAPAKITKLSEAIRRGAQLTQESKTWYLSYGCACAVGTAACGLGMTGPVRIFNEMVEFIAAHIPGTTLEFLQLVEHKHLRGMNRLQIADWLEEQGL